MDYTHLHLMLNHFPIIGTLIATVLMIWALLNKNSSAQSAILYTWLLMALIAIPVFLTGEPAEESVENIAGVQKAAIEAHEEAAELAFWLLEALGALSLLAIIMQRMNNATDKIVKAAFFLSIVVCIAMARTGYLGGLIRHSELSASTAQSTAAEAGGKEAGENGKDDDD